MKLKINGEIKIFSESDNEFQLETLLELLGYKPKLVVVELNDEIINPKIWKDTKIKSGDCLEVVTIVGGGAYS